MGTDWFLADEERRQVVALARTGWALNGLDTVTAQDVRARLPGHLRPEVVEAVAAWVEGCGIVHLLDEHGWQPWLTQIGLIRDDWTALDAMDSPAEGWQSLRG